MAETVFTAAIDALFADPNLARDAVFRAGGVDPGIPTRVIPRRPDRVREFGQLTLHFDQRDVALLVPHAQDEACLRFDPVRSLVSALRLRRKIPRLAPSRVPPDRR